MTAMRWIAPIVLTGAMLTGCDDKKAETPKAGDTPKAAADTANKAADTAKAAAADASKSAATAADAAKTATAGATDAAKNATAGATDAAKNTVAGATDAAKTQGSDLLAKLEAAIKDKKLDEAKTYLDKLNALKANLPADMQAKVENLQKMFDASKLTGGVPAVPGLGK